MAHLLSSSFFFKKIISPNFFGSQNLKLNRIVKNKKKVMFSDKIFIRKRKKLSKNFDEHYIFAKIIAFNINKIIPPHVYRR